MRVSMLLVLGLVMAGCSDAPPADAPDDGGFRDVVVSKDKGAISGVVIDAAVFPVAGATVRLIGQEEGAATDGNGSFVFEGLDPGSYNLNVTARGFGSVQSFAVVQAGEVTKIRIMLSAVLTVEARHTTLLHSGYIQANGGASGPILNIILEEMTGSNPLCDCTLRFNTEGQDIKTIVVEALWTDTVTLPTGPTDMYLEVFPRELDDGTDDIQGGFLTSPILKHYPMDLWGEDENNVDWRARLSGSGYYVQYDQSYELFVTLFENAAAPDGWSFVAGDE